MPGTHPNYSLLGFTTKIPPRLAHLVCVPFPRRGFADLETQIEAWRLRLKSRLDGAVLLIFTGILIGGAV